jgi:hypothetical protein
MARPGEFSQQASHSPLRLAPPQLSGPAARQLPIFGRPRRAEAQVRVQLADQNRAVLDHLEARIANIRHAGAGEDARSDTD